MKFQFQNAQGEIEELDSDNLDPHTAGKFIHSVASSLPQSVQQALVVRLADKVTMFGATFTDQITREAKEHESRYSVQVHPFPWQASGASNVIVHQNIFNELSVALVYNRRRDKRPQDDAARMADIPDYWKLPEGYMSSRPCKGGENGISLISSEAMDESEVLVLKGTSMQEAYKTIKSKKIDNGHIESPESSLKECAQRETSEEIGLSIAIEQIQLVRQVEQTLPVPTIANVFLIRTNSPNLQEPTLSVDGIEISKAIWGKLRAFRLEKDSSEKMRMVSDYYDKAGNQHSIEIPYGYALSIGYAIRKFRADEIQKNSMLGDYPLFDSRENVETRLAQILDTDSLNIHKKIIDDVLGPKPEYNYYNLLASFIGGEKDEEVYENLMALANLGKAAEAYHKKILALASAFACMPQDKPFNAEQLEAIVNEVPAIHARVSANRGRLGLFGMMQTVAENMKPEYQRTTLSF